MGDTLDGLPRYRSHKIVRAAPFSGATREAGDRRLIGVRLADGETGWVSAPANVFARGHPEAGDMIVVYDEDYISWSPKRVFDEGYRPEAGTHVFAGAPDARQSSDTTLPVSRFRPQYRALEPEEKTLHDELKAAYAAVESIVERIKPGRYRALALTELEASCMWAVKELTG